MTQGRKIFKKIGRIFLWLLVSIVSLVILLFIFINLPLGRKFIRNQAQSYLQGKLKTKVEIGSLDFRLPQWIELKNVYIEDQHKDTLLYGRVLRVDLHMLKLISGNTDIEQIYLNRILININRPETDSVFNYQFIIDAFSGNNPSTPNTDTSAMKLTLSRLTLDTVALNFKDKYAGNDFYAGIKKLDVKMDKFQPDRMNFQVKDINADGIDYFMTTYKQQQYPDAPVAVDTIRNVSYPLLVITKKLDLRNVNVQLDNKVSGMLYQNKVTHILSTNSLFNMSTTSGTTDEIFIDSTTIAYTAPKSTDPKINTDTTSAGGSMSWMFAAKNLRIGNSDIKYDDNNKPAAEGLDFAHLDLKKL
ncbi:MAG: AsmA family protein, partial [Ferruginibacter sp.]